MSRSAVQRAAAVQNAVEAGTAIPELAEYWRNLAACQGQTPLFYSEVPADIATARAICAACPVAQPCLADALASGDRFGMRAGLTAAERRRLDRERRAA